MLLCGRLLLRPDLVYARCAAQALWLRGESLLAPATAAVYQKIRQTVPPVDTDVVMYPQMAELDRLVKSGALLEAAEQICGRLL